jgi:16S rRNA (adenine1518-N6/adenine1519-N6)-dimethyltransferase
MAAEPDTENYGALSINVGAVARVEQMLVVPRGAFQPPPKVESSVVRITPLEAPIVELESLAAFRAFVQAAFSLRRKQMLRVLRTVKGLSAEEAANLLERAAIAPSSRPEVLSAEAFARLYRVSTH